jgi:hypothetical protein
MSRHRATSHRAPSNRRRASFSGEGGCNKPSLFGVMSARAPVFVAVVGAENAPVFFSTLGARDDANDACVTARVRANSSRLRRARTLKRVD